MTQCFIGAEGQYSPIQMPGGGAPLEGTIPEYHFMGMTQIHFASS